MYKTNLKVFDSINIRGETINEGDKKFCQFVIWGIDSRKNGSEGNVQFMGFGKTIESARNGAGSIERCIMFSECVIFFKGAEKVVYFVFKFYYVFEYIYS